MPKISIIVPVYNNEQYIRKCIDSILNQTFNDFEIILVDDGSTDGSVEICDEYDRSYEQVKVIHQDNKGPASARKSGVENARGEYVTFVDSDDYIAPDMLEKLYGNIIEGFDVVTCGFKTIAGENENVVGGYTFSENYKDFDNNHDMVKACLFRKYVKMSAWGKLVKKELYIGIDMCEGAIIGEDVCSTLQLIAKINRLRALPQQFYVYRSNVDSISHGGFTYRHAKGLDNYIRLCESMIESYPDMKIRISAFFSEYEMAAMTAMFRNDVYDKKTIKILKRHLRNHIFDIVKDKMMPKEFKVSAVLIIVNWRVFAFIFKKIRHKYGR